MKARESNGRRLADRQTSRKQWELGLARLIDVLEARIAELEAVIRQLSRDPEMADEYVLAQINIENKARIERLEAALKEAENRAALHSSDAALLNANNDRIFKICRKALKESGE